MVKRDLTEKGTSEQRREGEQVSSHPAVKDKCPKEMKWSVQRAQGIRGTARRLEQDG